MHFALRGYLLIVLTALLGVAGTWSDEPAFEGAWLFPAFLLLAGPGNRGLVSARHANDVAMRYDTG